MDDLIIDAARRGVRYVKGLSTRKPYPSSKAMGRLHELDQPLQDESVDPFEVLEILDTLGSPATVASTAGRYFGFVIGGPLPVSMRSKHTGCGMGSECGFIRNLTDWIFP